MAIATNDTYTAASGATIYGGRAAPASGLPYALPGPGEAVAISLNTAADVTPPEWSAGKWLYSLFDSYGGGAFVPTYSEHGAYALAGTGGHAHPDNTGAGLFNFTSGLWERLDNANGVARPTGDVAAFYLADGSGAPWHDIDGAVPLPPHPYATMLYLDEGSKGSIVHITRYGFGREVANSGASHRFDLATRMWSRFGDDISPRHGAETTVVWDGPRNRWWLVSAGQHNYKAMLYLDRADLLWKLTAATSGYPPSAIAGSGRAMLHDGLLVFNRGASGLWCFDPDDATAGWLQLSVTGTLPLVHNRWAHQGGRYYSYHGNGGNTLDRITPPVEPKLGTWVVDEVSVTGATLPAKAGANDPADTAHYSRLFLVPAHDCLAWIPGGSKPVYLIKPSE